MNRPVAGPAEPGVTNDRLRPRVLRLFAALHDDTHACHDLEQLAPWNPDAAEALSALLSLELDELERAGALPRITLAEADQITRRPPEAGERAADERPHTAQPHLRGGSGGPRGRGIPD